MIPRYSRPEMAKIWSDEAKYDSWLRVEIAVCEAWGAQGVIPKSDVEKIRGASYDIGRIAEYEAEEHHDFNSFLRSVADSLGEESRFVHLGLTSYDAEDTALSLRLVLAAELLERGLAGVLEAVESRAVEFKDTLCMGRSHGVHAEPMTFGLKLAGWVDEIRRNVQRLATAKAEIAVGKISGPVGTHASVPPDIEDAVCASLGLSVDAISTQVISRDRHASFIGALAVIAASLDRFATELRHLQRTEVLETEEPFSEGQTGSSSMPHKRNPEKSEMVCGLARKVRNDMGDVYENIVTMFERSLEQSSNERLTHSEMIILTSHMVLTMKWVIAGLDVFPERMRHNMEITRGAIYSESIQLLLRDKGVDPETA
ncbi:MAG: adenylosuccinate lyase, partial [Chloroflexi bacterium]|nr:adenylosuccinate lyase [Chloroflexota bacterium]